jgi:thiol-disulfide isomerase/thioredoxin
MKAVHSNSAGQFAIDLPPGHVRSWTFFPPPAYCARKNRANIEDFVLTRADPVQRKDYVVRRGSVWRFRITSGSKGKPTDGFIGASIQDNLFLCDVNDTGLGLLTLPTDGARTTAWATNRWTSVTGVPVELEWESNFRPDAIQSLSRVDGMPGRYHLTDVAGKTAMIQGSDRVDPISDGGRLLIRVTLLEPEPRSLGDLAGQVTDTRGRPIERALVELGFVEGGASGKSGDPRHQATTDSLGRYLIRAIPRRARDGKATKLILVVTKDGYAGGQSPEFTFQPRADGSPQLQSPIQLCPGSVLKGRVVDQERRPLEGVWVEPGGGSEHELRCQFVRTDAQGRFTVRNLPKGQVGFYFRYGTLWARKKLLGDDGKDEVEVQLGCSPIEELQAVEAKGVAALPARRSLTVGQFAPEWEVDGWSDGKSRTLRDYRGQVVLLDFWGIWCTPCVNELPIIARLKKKYEPRGVVFLAIHTPREDLKQIRKLLDYKKLEIVLAIDRTRGRDDNNINGVTAEDYAIQGYPTVLLIDWVGKIAFPSTDRVHLSAIEAMTTEMKLDPKASSEEQHTRVRERFLDEAIVNVLERH